jgi:gluconokinase
MNILAIEMSTSSVKALLYSSETGIEGVAHISLNKEICDVATQDAEQAYQSLLQCVKKITLSDNDKGKPKVDAISICTTWHSILYLDEQRNPMDRMYTWANNKAAETATRYRKDRSLTEWYYQKTGCIIKMHIRRRPPKLHIFHRSKSIFLKN